MALKRTQWKITWSDGVRDYESYASSERAAKDHAALIVARPGVHGVKIKAPK